jgi:uncharacterized protein
MSVAITCIALLGVLLFGLGLAVSISRGKQGRLISHSEDGADPLHRWVRAHGNTAEYVGLLAVLFLWHGMHSPRLWITTAIIAATVCRYLIVIGLLTCATLDKVHPLRFIGALGTYVAGFALAAAAPFVA